MSSACARAGRSTPATSSREHLRAASVALRNPAFAVAAAASILAAILSIVRNTFQSILLVRGLAFSEASIAVFPVVNAAVMLAALVFLVPTLARRGTAGRAGRGVREHGGERRAPRREPRAELADRAPGTALGGLGSAVVFPVTDSFLANAVPDRGRAKVMAVFYVVMFSASSPFGWVGGLLAAVSPRLPLALVAVVCVLGLGLSAFVPRAESRAAAAPPLKFPVRPCGRPPPKL